jgi:hypothetical protein
MKSGINMSGEARLLRGWFYADKVSKFGDVQWVDTELNIDDEDILYGERDDRDFVMGKVLEDLNFATANGSPMIGVMATHQEIQ